jgi:hypothetical protein
LVADGGGVAATKESPGGVGGIEELRGPEEPKVEAFALRALVTSCILLNFSWLLIISARQTKQIT